MPASGSAVEQEEDLHAERGRIVSTTTYRPTSGAPARRRAACRVRQRVDRGCRARNETKAISSVMHRAGCEIRQLAEYVGVLKGVSQAIRIKRTTCRRGTRCHA